MFVAKSSPKGVGKQPECAPSLGSLGMVAPVGCSTRRYMYSAEMQLNNDFCLTHVGA